MNLSTFFRYLGNFLLIFGYYILIWGDEKSGLIVKVIGGLFLIPSFFYFKMWDALTLCGFYFVIEMSRLYHLFVTDGR
jgi:hypothetical protein